MKRILLILLLIPMVASAEHHRGHALQFLDSLDMQLHQMQNSITKYANGNCEFSESDYANIDVALRYSGFALEKSTKLRAVLTDSDTNLNDARHLVNQPNSHGSSISTNIAGTSHRVRMLASSCADQNLIAAVQRLNLAWNALDRIIWHVTDAIHEEIYMDADAICSGPNNHCE